MSGSVLFPAGSPAAIDTPWAWWLLAGGGVLWAATCVVLVLVLRGGGRLRRSAPRSWLVGGGVLLPLAVLLPLGWATLGGDRARALPAPNEALMVGVTGRLWWWALRIEPGDGQPAVVSANELVLPRGRKVRLALQSDDVIHSLWIPALAGKVDLLPGRVQGQWLQAEQTGRFDAPCAEFCGTAHSHMRLSVLVVEEAAFAQWLVDQRRPAREPATPLQARGRAAFAALQCIACHTVRGLAEATLRGVDGGPELTHLASRAMLGAGVLPNDAAGLRRWLTALPDIKPGARMPSYAHLDTATLDALVAYLGSLD